MASRSGSRSRRQRSREPNEDFPALPTPRLPSLRSLAAGRARDVASPASWARAQARYRGLASDEPIRNLIMGPDDHQAGEFQQVLHHAWGPPTSSRLNRPSMAASDPRMPTTLEDMGRSLNETDSEIRVLLEMSTSTSPLPSLTNPSPVNSFSSPRPPHDYTQDHRRSKRRRLDEDRRLFSTKPFRYGTFGQVEPGQLLMHMVSCDGGMFLNEELYGAENILKDDGSVYCTRGNRCNIVLRHQGATSFTLQELIIRGPAADSYSHPYVPPVAPPCHQRHSHTR